MKQYIAGWLLVVWMTSCVGAGSKKLSEDSSLLVGQWVRAGYPEMVQKTGSAKAAFSLLKGYSSLSISPLRNDTITLVLGINNHEAMTGYLKPDTTKEQADCFVFGSDGYELDGRIEIMRIEEAGKTYLTLEEYDTNNKPIDHTQFVWIDDYVESQNPCDLVAARALYAGRYLLYSAEDKFLDEVELGSDLSLKNCGDYICYAPLTDYCFDNYEMVIIRNGDDSQIQSFIVEKEGDRLALYEALASDDSPASEPGKLVYTLVRKN